MYYDAQTLGCISLAVSAGINKFLIIREQRNPILARISSSS